ncbi:butyrophilin subfamily 2 member A1-like [Pelobates fuscus]|uniref:butyrophilin subfamily 2 member A1-like n=1 Tax=Pelobates fuscus TaxID=191477 RepID=UPI002FE4D73B
MSTSTVIWIVRISLILSIHKSNAVNFNVIAPSVSNATIGSTAVLHCDLDPATNAENMEIRWYKSNPIPYVHLYVKGTNEVTEQMPEFQGRTELNIEHSGKTRIFLHIHNVRPSDEGDYNCFFASDSFYNGAIQTLEVAAMGSDPTIHTENYVNDGIRLSCRSKGWYPKPQVIWRSENEAHLPHSVSEVSKNKDGLYEIKAFVNANSNVTYSCGVRNPILKHDVQSSIHISDVLLANLKRNYVSRFIMMYSVFCAFIAFIIMLIKGHADNLTSIKGVHSSEKGKQKFNLHIESPDLVNDNILSCKELEQSAKQNSINFEFYKIWSPVKESVTLNILTVPRRICNKIEITNSQIYMKKRESILIDRSEKLSAYALGNEGFTSGKHFWVVEMLDDWNGCIVGVAESFVQKNYLIIPNQKNGIYSVWIWKTDIKEKDSVSKTLKLRVCLDYEGKTISVFNYEAKGFIHKRYFRTGFKNKMFPFFRITPGAKIEL